MARAWTDQWVRELTHPQPGEAERVFHDPSLSKHRLVVTRHRKKFLVQCEVPKDHRRNGKRQTRVVIVADANDSTIEAAREKAAIVIGRIRRGEDPNGRTVERETTLGGAWEKFKQRSDLKPRTRAMYEGMYRRNLEKWKDTTLRTLVENPAMVIDEYEAITKRSGPSEATHAMRLLRSIYLQAAARDTSLPSSRNPCSGLKGKWHGDNKRKNAAIPRDLMPAWAAQVEVIRKTSPLRGAFHMLLLRIGCRPNELASAMWEQVDLKRRVLWIPDSKETPYEVPLSKQAVAEFKKLLEARALNAKGMDYVFPSRVGKRRLGHLVQYLEPRDVLSHSSNQLRHTHHTIGVRLKIDDRVLDPLEGRSILRSGLAGRGYIDTTELGPEMREAQDAINAEIDRLLKAKRR